MPEKALKSGVDVKMYYYFLYLLPSIKVKVRLQRGKLKQNCDVILVTFFGFGDDVTEKTS